MDAIKKKMQAMKLEKENAFDKADQLEQKLNEQKLVFEKVQIFIIIIAIIILSLLCWSDLIQNHYQFKQNFASYKAHNRSLLALS